MRHFSNRKSPAVSSAAALAAYAVYAALAAGPAAAQLTTDGNYRLNQSTLGALLEEFDHFGAALAAGDFNRDGWVDLAVGVPDEDVGAVSNAGAVFVAWGSSAGLGAGSPSSQALHQDVAGIPEVAETNDHFGAALAAGDFDGDGYDDLIVAVPGESGGGHGGAGALHVFLGSSSGLVVAPVGSLLYGDDYFPTYESATDANFGAALVACDRNDDGYDDLAIGIPSTDNVAADRPGKMLEVRGSPSGIAISGAVLWTFADSENGDQLGAAIACGDLDEDGALDLAVGAPTDSLGGAVRLLTSSHGVQTRFEPDAGTLWGEAVAIARFHPSREPQVVVGQGGFDADSVLGPGRVALGEYDRVASGFIDYLQGANELEEEAETFDHFGRVLSVGDFNRDGHPDLAIGVPDEDLYDGSPELAVNGGLVQVIPGFGGTQTGLGPSEDQVFHWGAFAFSPLDQDAFSSALAVGDFNKDGIDDLAIGAPGAEWSGQQGTGVVQILFGSRENWVFGDGFEAGGPWRWSLTAP